jgi:hypothetical protein
MIRPSLALLILVLICAVAHGQSFARRDQDHSRPNEDVTADQVIAAQAILLLKRLDDQVIVYGSRGEFEEHGKLARVPFETFQRDLNQVTGEVEELSLRLPEGKLKISIRNALFSYRDGAYWWQKVYSPKAINVSEFRPAAGDTTSSRMFFLSSLPYTVAVHWRQAQKHLQQAIRHF